MNMIKVRELNAIREIPQNYMKCTICQTYHAPESYRNEDQQHQSRTNCFSCYTGKSAEWDAITAEAERLEKLPLPEWDNHRRAVAIKDNTISVEEMIEALKSLPAGSRLAVVQGGNYAEGEFASVFKPQKDSKENYYIIGESNQYY